MAHTIVAILIMSACIGGLASLVFGGVILMVCGAARLKR